MICAGLVFSCVFDIQVSIALGSKGGCSRLAIYMYNVCVCMTGQLVKTVL